MCRPSLFECSTPPATFAAAYTAISMNVVPDFGSPLSSSLVAFWIINSCTAITTSDWRTNIDVTVPRNTHSVAVNVWGILLVCVWINPHLYSVFRQKKAEGSDAQNVPSLTVWVRDCLPVAARVRLCFASISFWVAAYEWDTGRRLTARVDPTIYSTNNLWLTTTREEENNNKTILAVGAAPPGLMSSRSSLLSAPQSANNGEIKREFTWWLFQRDPPSFHLFTKHSRNGNRQTGQPLLNLCANTTWHTNRCTSTRKRYDELVLDRVSWRQCSIIDIVSRLDYHLD